MRALRVLTWHVHGNYLFYLSQTPCDFYVPVKPGRPEGYGGRSGTLPWPDNLHEINAEEVKDFAFDCILYQSRKNYFEDQYEILSEQQRRLSRIYLEHDPPREHPTDTKHPVDDPDMLLVHVTHFNNLMWDSGRTPTRVIEHGVTVPNGLRYSGEERKGIVVINGIRTRARRVGLDVFEYVRNHIPLEIAGMASETLGGLGDLPHVDLAAVECRHRFFFNPIRYTSLGLAVCEAMMLGIPVVGLATTEMTTVIENGRSGFIDTNVDALMEKMQMLLDDPQTAKKLGENALEYARARFGIERFARDWSRTIEEVCFGFDWMTSIVEMETQLSGSEQ